MNHNLVWNFSLADATLLKHEFNTVSGNEEKWEKRFFWPANEKVILMNLGFDFLNFSHYKFTIHKDCYLPSEQNDNNIKIRKNKCHFKPQIKQVSDCYCYAKKQKFNLEKLTDWQALALLLPELQKWNQKEPLAEYLKKSLNPVHVYKEAFIHQFAPKVKLELSRITINDCHYLSVCIESKMQYDTERLASLILPNDTSTNYINFLKSR